MGGDLLPAPDGASAVASSSTRCAIRSGANLDRVQIIKGWLDADGNPQEKVYDVAWSDDREPGANGKLPPVGDTVDLSIPAWTNTIGAAELGTVWTDPDFDPALSAFYYARVIEIPTPRWTAYDAVKFNARPARRGAAEDRRSAPTPRRSGTRPADGERHAHHATSSPSFVCLALPAAAQDDFAAREAAVPENPLKDAYFGETHVHTSFSLDAYIGGARLTPFDAYRFAKGEDVSRQRGPAQHRAPARLRRGLRPCRVPGRDAVRPKYPGAPGHYQDALVRAARAEGRRTSSGHGS